MSFAALAVRTCFVQAIQGQTLADGNVGDGLADPAGLAARTGKPAISVSSERERLRPRGRSLLQGADEPGVFHANAVDLALSVTLPPPSGSGQSDAAADGGQGRAAAFAHDLIWRQITRALSLDAQGPAGAWADLWRRAVNGVVAVEHGFWDCRPDRAASAQTREIVMRLDVLDEPAFGALQSDFWPDFVAAVKGCDDLAGVAPAIEAALSDGGLPDWRALAALLGLRPADMAPLSLGPLGGGPADPVVPMAEAAVDGRGTEGADGALRVAP